MRDIPEDIQNLRNSMQLDSGQSLVMLSGRRNGYNFLAAVIVCGHVRVVFRDEVYKCASRMPQCLLDAYRDDKDPQEVALSDGGTYKTPYFCDEGNWLELIIDIIDDEGEIVATNSDDDVFDARTDFPAGQGPEVWEKTILDDVDQLIENLNQ